MDLLCLLVAAGAAEQYVESFNMLTGNFTSDNFVYCKR